MLKLLFGTLLAAMIFITTPQLSTAKTTESQNSEPSPTLKARFSRLRRGINLSHWFAQSGNNDYSKAHLESHTTPADLTLIKSLGFDHVRFTIEPTPLFNEWDDPSKLNADYLRFLDTAIDNMLSRDLAVIIDIHPSDPFKVRLNTEDRHVEAFAKFWTSLAKHLSTRDPERVFFEVINEPMVEDVYRWYGIQAKLISAIRLGAPQHTIIASGHRWSGLYELLALQPYSDPNVIYNFHFYEPFAFTHQGATWAGPNLPFYQKVPYPSTVDAVKKIMETVTDETARYNLLRYGEDNWNAERIDREIAVAAAWAANKHVLITCNEFGTFRRFALPEDRATWIRDMRVALEKYGIGWTMWDYAGGFGVVTKSNGTATPDDIVVKALGLKS
jgi:hypothetical protein